MNGKRFLICRKWIVGLSFLLVLSTAGVFVSSAFEKREANIVAHTGVGKDACAVMTRPNGRIFATYKQSGETRELAPDVDIKDVDGSKLCDAINAGIENLGTVNPAWEKEAMDNNTSLSSGIRRSQPTTVNEWVNRILGGVGAPIGVADLNADAERQRKLLQLFIEGMAKVDPELAQCVAAGMTERIPANKQQPSHGSSVAKGNTRVSIYDKNRQEAIKTEELQLIPEEGTRDEDGKLLDTPLLGQRSKDGKTTDFGKVPTGNYTITAKPKCHNTITQPFTIGAKGDSIIFNVDQKTKSYAARIPLNAVKNFGRLNGRKFASAWGPGLHNINTIMTDVMFTQEARSSTIKSMNQALLDHWGHHSGMDVSDGKGFVENGTHYLQVDENGNANWILSGGVGLSKWRKSNAYGQTGKMDSAAPCGADSIPAGSEKVTYKTDEKGSQSEWARSPEPGWITATGKPIPGWRETGIPTEVQLPENEVLPDDPLFNSKGSWGQSYDDQWALKRVGFTALKDWNLSGKDSPVVVAVIDSGIDLTHPELKGAIWTNPKEISANGKDDDNNGYIDDVHGWNFIEHNKDIRDYNGHGTVVAGLVAATVNNGQGIAGVNPRSQIMPVKAVHFDGKGNSIAIMNAVIYAVNNGAQMINISIGSKMHSYAEQEAIDYAHSKGVLVVVASGNEGIELNNYSPGGFENVITVASTDMDDKRCVFSNWGQQVDIAAPGVDVLSLHARGTDLLQISGPEDYETGHAIVGHDRHYYRVTGSSFSAPIVTGVASLILSQQPDLKAGQVRNMILNSATDIDHPGWDQFTGYGLLNARKAMTAAPDFHSEVRISGFKTVKGRSGKLEVEVLGSVICSDFNKAWLEMGLGDDSSTFKKVGKKIKKEINDGVIGRIPAKAFKEKGTYSIRVILKSKKHGTREAWGSLKIG